MPNGRCARPFTYIGLVSFSLYLWHWPVLVLYRHMGIGEMPPLLDRALLGGLAFALAVVTYRFIETPFRNWRPDYRTSVSLGAASMAAVAAVAFALAFFGGLPQRLPAQARAFEAYRDHTVGMMKGNETCFINSVRNNFSLAACASTTPRKKNVLVIGDSHAAHYMPSLRGAYPAINFLQVTRFGCRPALPLPKEACGKFLSDTLDGIDWENIDAVVLSGLWKAKQVKGVAAFVDWLATKKIKRVYVLGPSLRFKVDLPVLLAKEAMGATGLAKKSTLQDDARRIDKSLRLAVARSNAVYFSMIDFTCPKAKCKFLTKSGTPTHFDHSHFTADGASEALQHLRQKGFLAAIN